MDIYWLLVAESKGSYIRTLYSSNISSIYNGFVYSFFLSFYTIGPLFPLLTNQDTVRYYFKHNSNFTKGINILLPLDQFLPCTGGNLQTSNFMESLKFLCHPLLSTFSHSVTHTRRHTLSYEHPFHMIFPLRILHCVIPVSSLVFAGQFIHIITVLN